MRWPFHSETQSRNPCCRSKTRTPSPCAPPLEPLRDLFPIRRKFSPFLRCRPQGHRSAMEPGWPAASGRWILPVSALDRPARLFPHRREWGAADDPDPRCFMQGDPTRDRARHCRSSRAPTASPRGQGGRSDDGLGVRVLVVRTGEHRAGFEQPVEATRAETGAIAVQKVAPLTIQRDL